MFKFITYTIIYILFSINVYAISVTDFVNILNTGNSLNLSKNDTINLTGYNSITVFGKLNGNGATIIADSLFKSDSLFLFILLGGTIENLNIIGPNGNTYPYTGYNDTQNYFGGIRVRTTGKIKNVNFKNLDKWAIDIRGNRWTLTDSTFITNCTFNNIKRDGYGYAIWCQYGTAIIDSCKFNNGRHFIDGSSENNRIIITNSTFEASYLQAIHLHEYKDGYSGAGMDVVNCIFYRCGDYIDIYPPFPPATHNISNNKYWYDNSLLPGPVVNATDSVKINIPWSISATGYPTVEWDNGSTAKKITSTFKFPQVKVYSVKSINTKYSVKTVTVTDTGTYTAFWIKSHGAIIEIVNNGIVIKRINPGTIWKYYIFRSNVTIRIIGTGVVYLDDYISNTKSETFEQSTIKTKIRYNTTAKVDRFLSERVTGSYSLRIRVVNGSVEVY